MEQEIFCINNCRETSLHLEKVLEECPLIRFCETVKYAEVGDYPTIQECSNENYRRCLVFRHGFNGIPTRRS